MNVNGTMLLTATNPTKRYNSIKFDLAPGPRARRFSGFREPHIYIHSKEHSTVHTQSESQIHSRLVARV